jgi:hypothetical protein
VARRTLENQVADRIRLIINLPIPRKNRRLKRKIVQRLLIRNDVVIILLVLRFVQIGRIRKRMIRQRKSRRLPRDVRNLKITVRRIKDKTQPARIIDVIRKISEEPLLLRLIV